MSDRRWCARQHLFLVRAGFNVGVDPILGAEEPVQAVPPVRAVRPRHFNLGDDAVSDNQEAVLDVAVALFGESLDVAEVGAGDFAENRAGGIIQHPKSALGFLESQRKLV